MTSNKRWLLSSSLLLLLVICLVVILVQDIIEDAFQHNIPDYNYRLSLLIKQQRGKTISVSDLASGNWQKACFLGPYTIDSSAVLGVDWQISDFTNVLRSDGHNVLVFVSGDVVHDVIIQSRSKGDFSDLSGICLKRSQQLEIINSKVVQAG